jgi:L-rhamnose isomerase/sugar isomerase
MVRAWREARGLPGDPLAALREGGYVERIEKERAQKNRGSVSSYA